MHAESEARFREIEETQEKLRENIAESARLIETSQELLKRHRDAANDREAE